MRWDSSSSLAAPAEDAACSTSSRRLARTRAMRSSIAMTAAGSITGGGAAAFLAAGGGLRTGAAFLAPGRFFAAFAAILGAFFTAGRGLLDLAVFFATFFLAADFFAADFFLAAMESVSPDDAATLTRLQLLTSLHLKRGAAGTPS